LALADSESEKIDSILEKLDTDISRAQEKYERSLDTARTKALHQLEGLARKALNNKNHDTLKRVYKETLRLDQGHETARSYFKGKG
jgi:hypothetical protein